MKFEKQKTSINNPFIDFCLPTWKGFISVGQSFSYSVPSASWVIMELIHLRGQRGHVKGNFSSYESLLKKHFRGMFNEV